MKRPKPEQPDALLTVAQVAALRGVSQSAVKTACADPDGLRAAKFGRAWVIRASDAAAWVPRPVGWAKGRARRTP